MRCCAKFLGRNAPTFAQRPPPNVFHLKKISKKALIIRALKYKVNKDNFAFLVLFKLCAQLSYLRILLDEPLPLRQVTLERTVLLFIESGQKLPQTSHPGILF